jgi:hypothetical protein
MKILNTPQRTPEWYSARRGIPTCSRFDSILTPKTGKPSAGQDKLINELIAEAIMPPEQGVINTYVSAEMEQGMILEAEARCAFELQFATAPVGEVGFILHDSGSFGGSPDALVGDHSGVEIKCPQGATHVGYVRANELPPEYRCQVHGYMIVTGRNEWEFFSYARNLPPLRVLVRRDDFTASLERELLAFVDRLNTARKLFNLPKI